MPLANWLENSRQQYSDKVALIFGNQTWTYTAFDEMTDRVAASLSQMGVRPGDRVALHLPNCPELIFSYYACFKLGAIAVPLVPLLKAPELEYILNHCEARVCISHRGVFAEVESIRATVPSLQHCFLVGETGTFPTTQPFSALIQPLEPGVQFSYPIHDSRVAAILYTSGTTARPKGVTHTHATLQNAASYYVEWADLKQTDVLAGMLALTHIFGFTLQLLSAVRVGATLIILPSREPETLLHAMQQHRTTKLYGLPVMYNQLVNHPNAATYDLSALQACFAGGDAIAIALHERFKQVFGLELTEGCGMTEVIPYSMNPPFGEKRLGSIGKALIGMTLRLVDDHGNDVALGEVGEIWVKSDATMIGYWNNSEATTAVLQAGWLRTGDLAYRDRMTTTGLSAAKRKSSSGVAVTFHRLRSNLCSTNIPLFEKPL
ncbi:MAG: long-chain fatty acid--CoA ligase [Leptolyngbyaceae cyanobacterium RU_5_1]|nr:long-chain fatty acid--CoA ligase [Leptolyngbyaceae cyanobacterium RU_5_1]